jgi:hypothetical protein
MEVLLVYMIYQVALYDRFVEEKKGEIYTGMLDDFIDLSYAMQCSIMVPSASSQHSTSVILYLILTGKHSYLPHPIPSHLHLHLHPLLPLHPSPPNNGLGPQDPLTGLNDHCTLLRQPLDDGFLVLFSSVESGAPGALEGDGCAREFGGGEEAGGEEGEGGQGEVCVEDFGGGGGGEQGGWDWMVS